MKAMEGATAAFEDAAVIFSDIISALADFVSVYNDSLWIDEAFKDAEYDGDKKQVCFATPYTFVHVQRRGVKLWKVNRAVYRVYGGFVAGISLIESCKGG